MKAWIGCYCKDYPKLSWRIFTVSELIIVSAGELKLKFKETGNKFFELSSPERIIFLSKFELGDKVKVSGSPYDEQIIKRFMVVNSKLFYILEDDLPYFEGLLELVSRDLRKYRPCKNQCQD